MPSELSQFIPAELSAEDQRSNHALSALLDNLDTLNRWIDDIESERGEALRKRADLKLAIEPLMRAAPWEVRRRHEDRYLKIASTAPGRLRRLGGPIGHVLEFLVDCDRPSVRPADISHYLNRLDVEVNPKYAAKTLGELAKDGLLSRTGHGVYAINRAHPDMVATRLEMLKDRI